MPWTVNLEKEKKMTEFKKFSTDLNLKVCPGCIFLQKGVSYYKTLSKTK